MNNGTDRKDYIDVDDALKRVGGNMELLKKLLKHFLASTQLEPLEQALCRGDTEEATRLAHTLKGVAANLSLIKLRDISIELEHHIKNGSSYGGSLDELKQAFDTTAGYIAEVTG